MTFDALFIGLAIMISASMHAYMRNRGNSGDSRSQAARLAAASTDVQKGALHGATLYEEETRARLGLTEAEYRKLYGEG